ncbi:ABC transporter substrate-binding protein [Roseomonas sp. BN140053]|uniref:ABC transporter substrate-binding protein n=1 Tax=Roseomonas sp. BN140053 TaxID=3391898 RepID=UPI0039E7B562
MKAIILRGIALLAAVLALGGGTASAQTAVRFASAQNSLGSLPIVIARQQGFFTAEKINLEVIDFRGGAPAVQALASGSVEACICAADHAVRLRARNQAGLVLVALTEIHGYGLVALRSSPATDLASLRGQRVGITSAGSLTDNTLRYYMAEAGMNPDRDFQLIGVGTGGPMRAAIESGAVAAGMLTTPDVQAALSDPRFKLVQDFRSLQYPALDLVVMERWASANPDTARAVARAVLRGAQLVRSDRAAVDRALAEMFPALTPELRAVLAEEAPRLGSADGRMSREGYELMIRMLRVSDPTIRAVPYETVMALNYLPPQP